MVVCRYCEREIQRDEQDPRVWIDPNATGDDAIWREVCGYRETFTAEHEPAVEPAVRQTYADPQERVEAALLVAADVMVGFERDVYRRVAAEYRAVNNYVSEAAILELVQAELYDRREAAAAR